MKLNALEEGRGESAETGGGQTTERGMGGDMLKPEPSWKPGIEMKKERVAKSAEEKKMEKALPKALGLLRGKKHGGRWPFLLQQGHRGL